MWRPLYPTTAPPDPAPATDWTESIGLSFYVIKQGGATLIGHTGGQGGFSGFIYLNPANGKAVVAAFNTYNSLPRGKEKSAFNTVREAAFKLIE